MPLIITRREAEPSPERVAEVMAGVGILEAGHYAEAYARTALREHGSVWLATRLLRRRMGWSESDAADIDRQWQTPGTP